MALLKILSGDSAGSAYSIAGGNQRIGRADGNDLCIPDGSVSSAHCEIALDSAGNLFVRDLNSTNGTFIEGQRVREALVQPGQHLRLGNLEFVFENATPAPTPAPDIPVPLNLPPPPVAAPAPVRVSVVQAQPAVSEPVVAGPDDCINHPGVHALVVCTRCGKKACGQCTKKQKLGMNIVDFCLACGGQTKKLAQVAKEAAKAAATPTTFGAAVSSAFKYPLRGNGLILLLIGTILYAAMDLFLMSPTRFLNFYKLVAKLILLVLGYGYLFAYMQRIVTSSANGEEDPPEWPEISDLSADVIAPFFQLVFGLLFAFIPAVFAAIYLGPIPGQFVEVLGGIYFPMALLAVAMSNSYSGFNPIFVASSIMKIPKHYFLTCLIFLGLGFSWTHLRQAFYQAIDIPYVPHLVYWFVFLFLVLVAMRILGMLYFINRRQLGWGL